jgi:MFS family permease
MVPLARRTEGIAVFGVAGMVGLSVAGLLGDAVLARGTYAHLFALATAAAAVATLAGWWLPESAPRGDHAARRSFLASVIAPGLLPLWWVGLAFSLSLASYFAFMKTFVIVRGVGSVGAFFTGYTIVAVALRVFLGWLPDRIGAARTLVPAMLVLAGGLVLLARAEHPTDVVVAGVLCGAGHAFAFPTISALVVNRAHEGGRGSALAVFTALFDLGLLIGSPLFGLVLERSDYGVMFGLAAAMAATGALTWLVWERIRPSSDISHPAVAGPDGGV